MSISVFFITISTAALVLNTVYQQPPSNVANNPNEADEVLNSTVPATPGASEHDENELDIFKWIEAVCVGMSRGIFN